MAVKKFAGAKRAPPHETVAVEPGVILAIKALASGTANDRQQQIALQWIIRDCCGYPKQPYFAESARDTDFACGMFHVGNQIASIVNMSMPVSK